MFITSARAPSMCFATNPKKNAGGAAAIFPDTPAKFPIPLRREFWCKPLILLVKGGWNFDHRAYFRKIPVYFPSYRKFRRETSSMRAASTTTQCIQPGGDKSRILTVASKTPKPYCSVLLTRWTCASFQSTIVPSIQILSAFSIRLPDHLLAASRSTIVWPPIHPLLQNAIRSRGLPAEGASSAVAPLGQNSRF
jgi:hypothetical protein